MYGCLLPSSATVKMDNGENMENVNAMIVFADRLFRFVFKSWRFEKHASKIYFKITSL
jgi:hypothetical protein